MSTIFRYHWQYNTYALNLRLCYEHGADLLQVENEDGDSHITRFLESQVELKNVPSYFHLGIYQRQDSNQVYHRNGYNV